MIYQIKIGVLGGEEVRMLREIRREQGRDGERIRLDSGVWKSTSKTKSSERKHN